MSLLLHQVDAFTARPFAGNPAAVCLLPEPADAGWMQRVAREMNLSETAFLVPRADGFDLRWFTPTRALGHPQALLVRAGSRSHAERRAHVPASRKIR